MLAALHYDLIDPDSREIFTVHFILPGTSHRYRDCKPEGHGPIDLHQSIVQSCDTYFYQLAVKLGIDQIHGFLTSFGFGERTGIDVMNENMGVIPSREWKRTQFTQREDQTWYPGETVITGIGQGFALATPIQIAIISSNLTLEFSVYLYRIFLFEISKLLLGAMFTKSNKKSGINIFSLLTKSFIKILVIS